jgi:hypothetical protein
VRAWATAGSPLDPLGVPNQLRGGGRGVLPRRRLLGGCVVTVPLITVALLARCRRGVLLVSSVAVAAAVLRRPRRGPLIREHGHELVIVEPVELSGAASTNATESLRDRRCAPRRDAANSAKSPAHADPWCPPSGQWCTAVGILGGSCAIMRDEVDREDPPVDRSARRAAATPLVGGFVPPRFSSPS